MSDRVIRIVCILAISLTTMACNKSADKPADKKADAPKAETKAADKTDTKSDAPKGATGPIAKVNGVAVERAAFDKKYQKMTKAFTKRGKDIPAGLAQRYKESILKQCSMGRWYSSF